MFELRKENMYHMPHNAAIADELIFLLNIIDTSKKFYTFNELSKLLLIEEVKQRKFSEFHPRPHENLSSKNPTLYRNFTNNPEEYYEELINLRYSETKTWKQNWVEFARDYIDFAAYIGLLPCYYKTPGRASENDGYLVSKQLIKFRNGEVPFENILMDFKYSNASINTSRFRQFNIEVRPFYLGLSILKSLQENGIEKIERRLLFASISCAKQENISEIIDVLKRWIRTNGNILNENNSSDSFQKEAGRVATGMQDFFIKYNLVEKTREGSCHYFSITENGISLLNNIPKNSLYFGKVERNTGLLYSPLVGRILKNFADFSKNNLRINKSNFKISLGNVNEDVFNNTLQNIAEIIPTPISKIENDEVVLNTFHFQYHVVPYNDFADLKEIDFINSDTLDSTIQISTERIELPKNELLQELKNAALSSDGTRYENAINTALNLLPGKVDFYGSNSIAQRFSDVVWKISIPSIDGNKMYLIIFEAKAGNAIRSFNERNVIPQIQNTINNYRSDFKNIEGIWYIVLDSDQIPREGNHGGARQNNTQLTLSQKLFKIQQSINNFTGRTTLVTAFGIEAFIEYYKYLFAMSRQTLELNQISTIYINQFFNYGEVFTNFNSSYIKILRESSHISEFLDYGR